MVIRQFLKNCSTDTRPLPESGGFLGCQRTPTSTEPETPGADPPYVLSHMEESIKEPTCCTNLAYLNSYL